MEIRIVLSSALCTVVTTHACNKSEISVDTCFLIYFGSRRLHETAERNEKSLPVHNNSNIKSNTSTVIPRLTKIIRSGITFVSLNLR